MMSERADLTLDVMDWWRRLFHGRVVTPLPFKKQWPSKSASILLTICTKYLGNLQKMLWSVLRGLHGLSSAYSESRVWCDTGLFEWWLESWCRFEMIHQEVEDNASKPIFWIKGLFFFPGNLIVGLIHAKSREWSHGAPIGTVFSRSEDSGSWSDIVRSTADRRARLIERYIWFRICETMVRIL
jgi:hypothetical protein